MKRYIVLLCLLVLTGAATGCFIMPVEAPVPPSPVTPVPPMRALLTFSVAHRDVVSYSLTSVFPLPVPSEGLMFPPTPVLPIGGIYVNVGDVVQPGDAIASLYKPHVLERYTEASRKREVVLLDLSHIMYRHEMALDLAEYTGIPVDNSFFIAEEVRLRRELDLLDTEMEFLQMQNEARYLRTVMGGTVINVVELTPNLYTNTPGLRIVASIADRTETIFFKRVGANDPYIPPGSRYTIWVNQVPHEAVVIDLEAYGITLNEPREGEVYLALVDRTVPLPSRFSAVIRTVEYSAYNVLAVPFAAIIRIEGNTYVLVLNEYNIVTKRQVTAGLRGNLFYEIISGLEAGDQVVFP